MTKTDKELFGGQTINHKHGYKYQSNSTKAPTHSLGKRNAEHKISVHTFQENYLIIF